MKHNIKLFLLLLTIVVTYDASAVKKIEVGTPSSFRSGGSDRPQASLNFDLSTLSFSSGVTQNLPSAEGGSGDGSITYTSTTPSVCSISGSTVTALQSGPCRISATKAASGVYASVTVTRDTVIPSLTQAQVGASINTATINVGGTAQITGSGGSGNGVFNFQSSTPGICSISGNTITGVTNGTCSFSATKASDGLFAASNVTNISVTVGCAVNKQIEYRNDSSCTLAATTDLGQACVSEINPSGSIGTYNGYSMLCYSDKQCLYVSRAACGDGTCDSPWELRAYNQIYPSATASQIRSGSGTSACKVGNW